MIDNEAHFQRASNVHTHYWHILYRSTSNIEWECEFPCYVAVAERERRNINNKNWWLEQKFVPIFCNLSLGSYIYFFLLIPDVITRDHPHPIQQVLTFCIRLNAVFRALFLRCCCCCCSFSSFVYLCTRKMNEFFFMLNWWIKENAEQKKWIFCEWWFRFFSILSHNEIPK